MLRRTLLGFALAWAGWGFLAALHGTLDGYARRDRAIASPLAWRYGMPQVDRLAAAMAAVRAAMPAGSRVGFASTGAVGSRFLRWRWAASFAPELDLLAWDPAGAGAPAVDWLLVYGAGPPPPGPFREARPLPGGRLYRLLP